MHVMCWGLCQHVFLKYTRLIAWHLVFVIVFSVSRDITMVNGRGWFPCDFILPSIWPCASILSLLRFETFAQTLLLTGNFFISCVLLRNGRKCENIDVASLWQMFESFSWCFCFRFCFCFASQTMARKWTPPKCLGTCGTEQENALNRFS